MRKRWTAAFGGSDVMGFRLWLEKFARSLDKSRNLHTLDSVPYGTAINEKNQNFVNFRKKSRFSILRLTFYKLKIINTFFHFLSQKIFNWLFTKLWNYGSKISRRNLTKLYISREVLEWRILESWNFFQNFWSKPNLFFCRTRYYTL